MAVAFARLYEIVNSYMEIAILQLTNSFSVCAFGLDKSESWALSRTRCIVNRPQDLVGSSP